MLVLCIQPHNDDCAIGVGGIIAKLVEAGVHVEFGYMTDGRHGSETIPPRELRKMRRQEAIFERDVLGATKAFDLKIEDGTLSSLSRSARENAVNLISDYFRRRQPEVIFVPSKGEGHPDHRAAHDLALAARTRARSKSLVVMYSVWFLPPFYPETRVTDPTDRVIMVGIDKEAGRKLQAIRKHRSQVKRGHYDERAQALSRYLALALKAFDSIKSRFVEVVGVSGSRTGMMSVEEFIDLLQPCTDVTELVHGRRSRRIPGTRSIRPSSKVRRGR